MGRVLLGPADDGGDECRQHRLRRGRRFPAGVRAGRRRGDRLCRGPAHHQRPGHSGAAEFGDPHRSPISRASASVSPRDPSAHNVVVQTLEKAGLDLCRHHAGLFDAAGRRPGLRQWQHRCLGDLGSVFRDRRDQAERPHPGQRPARSPRPTRSTSPTATSRKTTAPVLQQIIDVTTLDRGMGGGASRRGSEVAQLPSPASRSISRPSRRSARPSGSGPSPTTSSRPSRASPTASSSSA